MAHAIHRIPTEELVRFHELGLCVGFFRDALAGREEGMIESSLQRIGALLRRVPSLASSLA